ARQVHERAAAGQAVDRRQERRHHLGLAGDRVGRPQADARPRRAERDQRRPHVGVAAEKRGVVRGDRLGAVVVGHLRQVDEPARVHLLQQRRSRAQADSECDFHLVSSRLATRGPPLTYTVSPVMKFASSDATKMTAHAISSGRPRRWSGTSRAAWAIIAGVFHTASTPSVSTGPGATALTVIPYLAHSAPRLCVSTATAALVAA